MRFRYLIWAWKYFQEHERTNKLERERTHKARRRSRESLAIKNDINSREASHEAPRQDKTHWREIVSRCATWIRGAWRYNNINNNNNYSKSVACRLKGKRSQWTRRNAMWRVNCMSVFVRVCQKHWRRTCFNSATKSSDDPPLARWHHLNFKSHLSARRIASRRVAQVQLPVCRSNAFKHRARAVHALKSSEIFDVSSCAECFQVNMRLQSRHSSSSNAYASFFIKPHSVWGGREGCSDESGTVQRNSSLRA